MNEMKNLRIEKVTLNIGTGEAGEKLEKAKKLLSTISGKTPVVRKATKRIPTWGVRPGLELGVKITLRGKDAEEVLIRTLNAKENLISKKSFDQYGNFGFGLQEYIDIPGLTYMPEIGTMGLDITVTLERKGFRVKRRKYFKKSIPEKHRVTKEEAIKFIKTKFKVNYTEEEEE
ncbi:50S ribosomal protein L5 [archaeon]|jgi:large subunit ribosomal protein L5|nr:50S ribosomal protein L5 [archaeon]